MKSFVPERDQQLILSLVLGQVTEPEFLVLWGKSIEQARAETAGILLRSYAERDPLAVELSLHIGHHFGFLPETLNTLIELAQADWHERHEDVIDAMVKLRAPESASVLERAALTTLPYREFDDAHSLRLKAVRALGALATMEAVSSLARIAQSDKAIAAAEATEWLARIAVTGTSDSVRAAAAVTLNRHQ